MDRPFVVLAPDSIVGSAAKIPNRAYGVIDTLNQSRPIHRPPRVYLVLWRSALRQRPGGLFQLGPVPDQDRADDGVGYVRPFVLLQLLHDQRV